MRAFVSTSLVTSASRSGSVVMQSYQCSLSFITLCNFLNNISKIMGPTMQAKQELKLGSNRRHFMEKLTLVNGERLN
jgi:hypothetical protein